MHHKRHRPKKQRAGCLMCKPHKGNGSDRRTVGERRQDAGERADKGETSE